MRRRLFADTGDSRWGNLDEPKKQNSLPVVIGGLILFIGGLGPGLYIGAQKTEQEWKERRGEGALPPGIILSTQVTLTGKMKVEMLLNNGPVTLICPVRRDIPIRCTSQN